MLRKVTFRLICIFSICNSEFVLAQKGTQEEKSIELGSPINYTYLILFSYTGTIDENSFPNLTHMTGLFLINCNLDTFILPELTNLDYLGLINSSYPTVSNDTFANANNIKTLELFSSGQVDDFAWISSLTKIKSLGVHGTKRHTTGNGSDTEGLKSLEYFSISGTDIDMVEPALFDNIPDVKTVDLSNTEIGEITNETFRSLEDLEYLNLLGTKLGTVTDFDISVLKRQQNLETLGIPTEILKKTNFNKVENTLPNLKTLIIFDTEKGSTDVDEVKKKVDGKFEISYVPNAIMPARDIPGVIKFKDLPYIAKNQPGGVLLFG